MQKSNLQTSLLKQSDNARIKFLKNNKTTSLIIKLLDLMWARLIKHIRDNKMSSQNTYK